MTNHVPSSLCDSLFRPRMDAFDDVRKEVRDMVVGRGLARQGSVFSINEDQLDMIRRNISPVIIRNSLIEGGLSKTFAVRPRRSHKICLIRLLNMSNRISRASPSPKHAFRHVVARRWRQMIRLLCLKYMTGFHPSFFREMSLVAGLSMSKAGYHVFLGRA